MRVPIDREPSRGGSTNGLVGGWAVGKERYGDLLAEQRLRATHHDPFGAALLRAPRGVTASHLHEHRDAVAFRDRLAQPSVGHGARC